MPIGTALTRNDVGCRSQCHLKPRGTYLVKRIRGGKRKRQQVVVGVPDGALAPNAGCWRSPGCVTGWT
jgi:hypothetical protein